MSLLLEPQTPAVLSASILQVDTPQRIPAPLLQPFHEQHQDVLLVASQGQHRTPARLAGLYATYLLVETAQAVRFRAYRQQVLLVVFPVGPTCHYVVQTEIEEVYLTRLTLRYQDPRYDRRWPCEGTVPVALTLAPPEVGTLFTAQQVRIVRELAGLPPERTAGGDSALRDRVLLAGTPPMAILPPWFTGITPLCCSLRDISLGGAGVTLWDRPAPAIDRGQLVQLQLRLPGVTSDKASQAWAPLHLQLLGEVRQVNRTALPWTLHMRFLQRLPEALNGRFAALAPVV